MTDEFPTEGVELTHLLVVSDIEASRSFYHDILGASTHREYGGTSCVLNFQGSWILLVTGGEPTKDKPDITFSPPGDTHTVDHELTIRVPDCEVAYEILQSRGAEFLTPPVDWGYEKRCFFRDPDGHLLEISEILT
jgi:catechol 2,3-dioxygenase-like lactoylglutathione lyase family enzyme